MSGSLVTRLAEWGLLSEQPLAKSTSHASLLALCHAGALKGGLSVAQDVAPDELWGPLAQAIGGAARSLRVLDVLNTKPVELAVSFAGREEMWRVADAVELALRFNDALAEDPAAQAVVVLGEWEAAWQFWCVPKDALRALLKESNFRPDNRSQLEKMLGRPSGRR